MPATIDEGELTALDQATRRVGDEHFSGTGEGHVVALQATPPRDVAELRRSGGRIDDVGHDDRRQHAVAGRRRGPSVRPGVIADAEGQAGAVRGRRAYATSAPAMPKAKIQTTDKSCSTGSDNLVRIAHPNPRNQPAPRTFDQVTHLGDGRTNIAMASSTASTAPPMKIARSSGSTKKNAIPPLLIPPISYGTPAGFCESSISLLTLVLRPPPPTPARGDAQGDVPKS